MLCNDDWGVVTAVECSEYSFLLISSTSFTNQKGFSCSLMEISVSLFYNNVSLMWLEDIFIKFI